ncbi:MAG TPA: protein kinase [Polyangia bacterium]|nr:protein kinase [Polyangia bacterium]
MTDPLIGAVLGDRYRIVSRIGAGGMGAVYLAQHTTLRRDVAIKVLLSEFGGKDEFVRRFEREAEAASRLTHPNIIQVTDFGRTSVGQLFLAMEYLKGQSLTSVIREGRLPVPRALGITRQILAGLSRAHAAGVVHRDLKPDNIMLVEQDGRPDVVKILDFGIAKVTDAQPSQEALTQAGVVFGTPEYLSPEQALGDNIDARADLYAAGVILFEMLTGRRPFESDDKVRIISMHLSHPVPRFATVAPGVAVPLPIEEVTLQALEKQRENRFASAAAFLTALDDAETLSKQPAFSAPSAGRAMLPSPPAVPAASPTVRTTSRWKRPATIAGALLAVAVLAFAVYPRSSARSKVAAMARLPSRPAPLPQELAAQIRAVEALLSTGEIVKTRVALEQLLAEHPQNARVRYLLGRLAFAEEHRAEALGDYREAIALDAGFRGDPVLLEHLAAALGDARVADVALDLAIDRVGAPAVGLLTKVANGNGELRRRERAAHALSELGQGDRVDMVQLRIAQLKRATTCEERKPLVVALGNSDDPRALPSLRAQRPRGGLEGLFGGDAANGCMKTELADAITRLEEKLPPESRSNTKGPAHRTTSARPSFFRGR